MKIIRLVAENIKKLKAVEIKPDGSLVQITGPNGSGKSSVLDAIYYALAGTKSHPSTPVRKGQEKASVRLELGEVTVIRRFTKEGGTSLIVETAEGARYPSPQKLLDDLLGALTFDPLAFTRMEPAKQLETIRSLVKIDGDLYALDQANAADYERRSKINKEIIRLFFAIESAIIPDGTPNQPILIDDLVTELETAGQKNVELESRRAHRAEFSTKLEAKREERRRLALRLRDLAEEIAKLQASVKAVEERQAALDLAIEADEKLIATAAPLPVPIDTNEIKTKISQARAININVTRAQEKLSNSIALVELKRQAAAITDAMANRQLQKSAAIAAAKMPVDGLSFTDFGVTYNDVPFAQASSAEQLRVSVAIAMSANPKLRIIRIQDGSLLDDANLAVIAEMAQKGDYQIWIERVDASGKVGIVMEDGAIKAEEVVA